MQGPTLYDIVRYLDRRLQKATEFRAQGYKDGMAEEVEALDVAITALYPFVRHEMENPHGER